jgi:hypothetical protein
MPNKVYKFVEVSRNFQRAGLPISYSRFWTETPLNAHKVTSIYPYHPYIMANRVNITRMNRELNLDNIPYKSELALGPLPNSLLENGSAGSFYYGKAAATWDHPRRQQAHSG